MDSVFDRDHPYVCLVNQDGQHSLWPASARIPDGWSVSHGPADRDECLEHVERHWTNPHSSAPLGSTAPQR